MEGVTMKYRILLLLTVCMLSMGIQQRVFALEDINFSGYFTLKGTYTDANQVDGTTATKYGYGYASKNVDFDTTGNHIGLQANAQVTDELEMTLVMQANGGGDKYSVDMAWAYASYSMSDDFTLRLGRIKGPFFMVSEYKEVGYAYPWVTPPQEVYSTNPIEAVTGLDLVYQTGVGNWDWLFELYAGSGKNEAIALANVADYYVATMGDASPITKGATVDFSTNGMIGFNTTFGTQGISFRAGYFSTKVDVTSFGINDEKGTFGGIGMIVDWRNMLIYSEYIVRDTQNSDAMKSAFPDQKAGYITLGYRFGDFMPYVTAANMDKGKDNSSFALKQSSYSIGFRYEAAPTAAIKFEATQIKTDSDTGDYGAYGLFDDPVKNNKGNVIAASFDLIF